MVMLLRRENGHLLRRLHVAERKLHSEAVHLCLRQGIGASKFDGVLRGDDEEESLQITAFAIYTNLALTHRLQQSRLGAGRRAVDLIRQQDVGEDRPLMEMELLIALAENGYPQDVRGQQVGRELDALEFRIHRPRQSLR